MLIAQDAVDRIDQNASLGIFHHGGGTQFQSRTRQLTFFRNEARAARTEADDMVIPSCPEISLLVPEHGSPLVRWNSFGLSPDVDGVPRGFANLVAASQPKLSIGAGIRTSDVRQLRTPCDFCSAERSHYLPGLTAILCVCFDQSVMAYIEHPVGIAGENH